MGKANKAIRPDDLRCNPQRLAGLRKKRDDWFKANRGRLEREKCEAIGLELRRRGFYSQKTSLCDITCSIEKACMRLGIPTRFWNGAVKP